MDIRWSFAKKVGVILSLAMLSAPLGVSAQETAPTALDKNSTRTGEKSARSKPSRSACS